VGVVLVAGESSISRKVYHGVFTLVVSPKLRLDKYQPSLPKRRCCADKVADQAIKFDHSVFAIKMVMIQALYLNLHFT
jgi:hypothetical protein